MQHHTSQAQKAYSTATFTPRETQIIRLLAQGLTADEIAGQLYISFDTVRTHRKNILQKSGCRNTVHLVAECVRHGLI